MRKLLFPRPGSRPDHRASMGPQLYRCGNMSLDRAASNSESSLQWGRNFIVAETGPPHRLYPLAGWCFNGAATLSLRKLGRPALASRHGLASMGPQLYRCGNLKMPSSSMLSSVQLQWGRNFIVAETSNPAPSMLSYSGFNGAATLSLRKRWCIPRSKRITTWLQWGRNFIVAET